jgi:shikimate kinase
LSASPKTIYHRIKDSRHRPLLDGKDKLGEIKRLLELRRTFYEKADFQLQTDGRSSAQVAGLILERLAGKL